MVRNIYLSVMFFFSSCLSFFSSCLPFFSSCLPIFKIFESCNKLMKLQVNLQIGKLFFSIDCFSNHVNDYKQILRHPYKVYRLQSVLPLTKCTAYRVYRLQSVPPTECTTYKVYLLQSVSI